MRRLVERILLWLVLPLALVLTAAEVWRADLQAEYEDRLDVLRMAGEPVSLDDLAFHASPQDERLLADAIDWYRSYEEERGGEPWYEIEGEEEAWTEADWERVAAYIEGCAPFIDRVESLSRRASFAFGLALDKDGRPAARSLHHLMTCSYVLRYWSLTQARREGGSAESIRGATILLDLMDRLECIALFDFMICTNVREGVLVSLCDAARLETFELEAALEALGPRLAAIEETTPLAEYFRRERVFMIWHFDRWTMGEGLEAFLGCELGPAASALANSRPVRGLAFKLAHEYLDYMEQAIPLLDLPPEEALPPLRALCDEEEGHGPFAFVSRFRAFGERIYRWRLEQLAHGRLRRVELALRLHYRRTGEWASSLDSIATLCAGGLRPDPWQGNPIAYERTDASARIWIEPPREWEGDTDDFRIELEN